MSKNSLKHRVLHASIWSFIGYFSSQAIRFGSNLIMTRLLAPEMFGIMSLASALMFSLQLFSDMGFLQNIVQSRRGGEPAFLNTIWTMQIIRGVLIWLLMLASSILIYLFNSAQIWPMGSTYTEPVLPYVIVALSFCALISGLESTKIALAYRNLILNRLAWMELISQLTGVSCMLVIAYVTHSIWALIIGSLLSSSARTILSHIFLPGTQNKLHLDKEAINEIIKFGKWITVTSIIGVLSANGDRFLLGGLMDATTFGLYAIAAFIATSIRDIFYKIASNVAFPALSEVARECPERLIYTYYKFRVPIDAISLMSAGALFLSGRFLIYVLYDSRYNPAGHMLEILSLSLFEVRYALAGQCFLALGMPKVLAPLNIVRLLAIFILLPIAFYTYGLEGALWVAGGNVLMTMPLTFYFKIKYGLFNLSREVYSLIWLMLGLLLGFTITTTFSHG